MTQNIADITLTPAEILLASRIQFDEQVLRVVKSMHWPGRRALLCIYVQWAGNRHRGSV